MLAQTLQRTTQRPLLRLIARTVARRVIARGMRRHAISHQLDERSAMALARTFSGPTRRGIHGKKVVTIHTQARNAIPRAARGKRRRFTRSKALKGGDSPLVVHHVQHARRAVRAGEQQRMMEIGFGAGALANPTRRHMVFALDGRSHGPTHCLRKLRGQVARDRKQAGRARVIHDGQLPALAHITRVRQQLVH